MFFFGPRRQSREIRQKQERIFAFNDNGHEVVKSRHSRLSGIGVFYNVLKRDDSGRAGMTSKEGYSTSYEIINLEIHRVRSQGTGPVMRGIDYG